MEHDAVVEPVARQRRAVLRERAASAGEDGLRLPAWAGRATLAVVVALVLVPVLAAGKDQTASTTPAFGATSARLASAGSHRYDYWRVAASTWAAHPLLGVGSGGYAVAWLRARPQPERIRDAHSLPLETLAELGLAGAALLAAAVGGVVLCARRVQAADPVLAAGPAAALVAFGLHASIDWDWEMPTVSLAALVLAGMLVARAGVPGAHDAAPGSG